MKRTVNKLENCHVEVLVTVDEAAWKNAQEKAFKKLAKNITIPGFRKGNAPEHLLKGRIDPMKQINEAINIVLPEVYEEIMREEKIRAFDNPTIEPTKVSDTELEIRFGFVTFPTVELGKYKGFELGKKEVSVSEEEIDESIKALLNQNASLVLKEGDAQMGDTVVIDFEGFVDGKAFDGGKGENYDLELGSHSFIPGFEEGCVSHKAGDEFDLNVKFPENYVENLKGKDATFKVKLHEVKEKKIPELTDEVVKDLVIEGVENIASLREHQKTELLNKKTQEEKKSYYDRLTDEIVKDAKFEIAPEFLEAQVKGSIEDLKKRVEQNGLKFEQYLQIVGQTEEVLRENARKDMEKQVKKYFAVIEVGAKEELKVSDEELEFEYAKIADQYKMKVEDVKKALAQQAGEFRNNLLMKKIEDFLFENNK